MTLKMSMLSSIFSNLSLTQRENSDRASRNTAHSNTRDCDHMISLLGHVTVT